MAKTWLITGCSTGFGRLLTERALGRGDRVVATARRVDTLTDLGKNDEESVLRLPLDVRESDQITLAVEKAREAFGEIDILVNNAGYGYFGTQEEGELDEIRAMYETNVFGLIRMSQAVIPHMRARRAGTIMNLSSIAGNIGTPRGGFYQSTKWAVEALCESLFQELSSFGIRVVSIQPGFYGTDFAERSARVAPAEQTDDSPYAALRPTWRRNSTEKFFTQVQDANEVVDAMIHSADSDQPFARIPVGKDTNLLIDKRNAVGNVEFVTWLQRELHED